MTRDGVLQVEVLPAAHGDSILVRCVEEDTATNILIDGGPASTYEAQLRPRLIELAQRGESIELLVVTHVDSDHIGGVIELLKENGSSSNPNLIPIQEVWHNSYRHLALRGRPPTADEKQRVLDQVNAPTLRTESTTANISALEGTTLGTLLTRHGYGWNTSFSGRAVEAAKTIDVGRARISILSPEQKALDRLARWWRRQLLKMGVSHEAVLDPDFEASFESKLLSAKDEPTNDSKDISADVGVLSVPLPDQFREDTSVTNTSSIAFLLEFGSVCGLFLGDAIPSVVLRGLDAVYGGDSRHRFELVKVAHHGSKRNTSPELLERIESNHFLFSTDGTRHGHPDIETLLWIVSTHSDGTSLAFNHNVSQARLLSSEAALAKFGHTVEVAYEGNSYRLELKTSSNEG